MANDHFLLVSDIGIQSRSGHSEKFSPGLTPYPDLDHMAGAQSGPVGSSGQTANWLGYTG
jgi:hypothetical protein